MTDARIKSMGKFMVFLIFFAQLFIPGEMWAKKQKHGAQLVIEKKSGSFIEGELLAVKKSNLVLLDAVLREGVEVNINETRRIKIIKKANFLKKAGYGLLIGAGSGAVIGLLSGNDAPSQWFAMTAGEKALYAGIGLGVVGFAGGSLYSALSGLDKTIQIEGKTQPEIEAILNKLQSMARYQEEIPENFKINKLIAGQRKDREPPRIEKELEVRPQDKIKSAASSSSTSPSSLRPGFPKVHLSYGPCYFYSLGINNYAQYFPKLGFFSDETKLSAHFLAGEVKVDYSITDKIAVGVGYSYLGKNDYSYFSVLSTSTSSAGLYLYGDYSVNLYYLSLSYKPVPAETFLKKSFFSLGAGLGLSSSQFNFGCNSGEKSFAKKNMAVILYLGHDYYFSQHWSVGVRVEYKYVPVKMEDFKLVYYFDPEIGASPLDIYFRQDTLNLGGWGIGLNLGVHL